ncbi:MAG: class I SAM-dependent methyltransferase [Bacteroidales bacterium]|nr:class I SAM-dependent methyltransferase [Bacteroidales bacterium]
MNEEQCPLCHSLSPEYFRDKKRSLLLCPFCKALFAGKNYLPDRDTELIRYTEHNNDVDDPRYQKFVQPITGSILRDFTPEERGLDFGAGTGPVISKLLQAKNYQINQYDPFFHDNKELLSQQYDYIACCEVIEHFHRPDRDFSLLRGLLMPKGKLYCMTSIYNETIDLKTWYYKNDLTHVFFYQEETFYYISRKYGFSDIKIKDNLIILSV